MSEPKSQFDIAKEAVPEDKSKEEAESQPSEESKDKSKEESKQKSTPIEGLVCKSCNAPVTEFEGADGNPRYYCTEEKRITTAIPKSKMKRGEPPSEEGKIKEEDVVGDMVDHSRFLENFLSDFEVKDSFVKLYKKRYKRRETLPTPQSLAADLMDMPSGIANDRYANYIAEEYQAELESKGYLNSEKTSTMRSDISLNPQTKNRQGGGEISLNSTNTEDLEQMREVAKEAGTDLDKTIDKIIDRQLKMRLLEQVQSGGMFGSEAENSEGKSGLTREEMERVLREREEEEREERERSEMLRAMQQLSESTKSTFEDFKESMDNIESRVRGLEERPMTQPVQETNSSTDIINDKMREAMAETLLQKIRGEEEEGELTKEDLMSAVKEASGPSAPTGEMNEYDMEVRKAEIMADAEKTKAQEGSKAYESLGNAIREGLSDFGFSMGQGAAQQPAQPQQQQPVQQQAGGPTKPKMEGDKITVDCPHGCGGKITLDKGQSRAICPKCGKPIFIQPKSPEPPKRSEPKQSVSGPESKLPLKKEEPEETEPEKEEEPSEPEEEEESSEPFTREKPPVESVEESEEEGFTCAECGKTFDAEQQIIGHSLGAHKDRNAWKSE